MMWTWAFRSAPFPADARVNRKVGGGVAKKARFQARTPYASIDDRNAFGGRLELRNWTHASSFRGVKLHDDHAVAQGYRPSTPDRRNTTARGPVCPRIRSGDTSPREARKPSDAGVSDVRDSAV